MWECMHFRQKYASAVVALLLLHLKAMLYTQFLLFLQYCTQKKFIAELHVRAKRARGRSPIAK